MIYPTSATGTPELLTLIVFTPAAGAFALLFINRKDRTGLTTAALTAMAIALVLSVLLAVTYDAAAASRRFSHQAPLIPAWDASYFVRLDGLNLPLVPLAALLAPLGLLASYRAVRLRYRQFCICVLLLEMSLLGALTAHDLLLFFVFWAATLGLTCWLVRQWGGFQRRAAAINWMVTCSVGAAAMLGAMLALHRVAQEPTFNVTILEAEALPPRLSLALFVCFVAGLAVAVPLFPFRWWLRDAHAEAPTAGSVLLTGVVLKVGAYGLLRFCLPLFPEAAATLAPLGAALGLVWLIEGAVAAAWQKDLKRLLAYTSLAHMGLVILAVFSLGPTAAQGAVLLMVSHGLATGALFFLAGMIEERRYTRRLDYLCGIPRSAPRLRAALGIAILAAAGLPGLSGFAALRTLIGGVLLREPLLALGALGGLILLAGCFLRVGLRLIWGGRAARRPMRDLSGRELAVVAPLLLLSIWIGISPLSILDRTRHSVIETFRPFRPVGGVSASAASRIVMADAFLGGAGRGDGPQARRGPHPARRTPPHAFRHHHDSGCCCPPPACCLPRRGSVQWRRPRPCRTRKGAQDTQQP